MMYTTYSALISVYSKENDKYFEQALKSIFEQTVLPSEFVIIKDGKLPMILNSIIDKYKLLFEKKKIIFIVIENQKNIGLARSLNKGLKHCTNDLIARFDSDDINDLNRMKKTLVFFNQDQNLSVLGSFVDEFNRDISDITRVRQVPLSTVEMRDFAKKRNPMNHPSVTFKRVDVLKVDGYEDVPHFEDYHLWIKMILANMKLENTCEILVHYRVDKDFITRRSGISYFFDEVNFQRRIKKMGFINEFRFLYNILTRGLVRLFPRSIIKVVYQFLRT